MYYNLKMFLNSHDQTVYIHRITRVPTGTGKARIWESIFQLGKSQGILNMEKVREFYTKYRKMWTILILNIFCDIFCFQVFFCTTHWKSLGNLSVRRYGNPDNAVCESIGNLYKSHEFILYIFKSSENHCKSMQIPFC